MLLAAAEAPRHQDLGHLAGRGASRAKRSATKLRGGVRVKSTSPSVAMAIFSAGRAGSRRWRRTWRMKPQVDWRDVAGGGAGAAGAAEGEEPGAGASSFATDGPHAREHRGRPGVARRRRERMTLVVTT
jgi:hypothetical protein